MSYEWDSATPKSLKEKNSHQYYSLRADKPKWAKIKAKFHNSCPNNIQSLNNDSFK